MTFVGTAPTISTDTILTEAESFFTAPPKIEHAQVLQEILSSLVEVDFRVRAKLEDNEKLPQKHLLVMCVDELLAKVREKNFGLMRKNDFIFIYNGEYCKELDREVTKDFLGQVAEKFSVNALEARHYEFKEKLYKQFVSSTYFKVIEPKTNTVLINLQNGTFEITKTSQKLRPFSVDDFLTYQLPFDFDEDAGCPLFQTYLDRVLPEKELQDILAEYFGYVFTKGLKMEKALLLYGSGANGKSVLFDVMNALLGRENISNFSLSNLLEEHNRALIAHKLLNYGSEINATKTKDEFKNLVSTEPIQARLKYGNSFLMENYAKLCFNCNELPKDVDYTNAYFRRLLIVPFRVTIPEAEQDKTLANKIISNELPGIFNWILAGLKRLLTDEKFTDSQIVKATVEEYKRESDSVASFVGETESLVGLTLKTAYADYRTFSTECGFKPLGRNNFSKRLQAHGFLLEPLRNGLVITEKHGEK